MSSSVDLNFVLIRSEKNEAVAHHVLQLLQEHKAIDVCNALLEALSSELLPNRVFSIFLSATKSIDCITACLRQNHSIRVRASAIKQYGKALANVDRWQEAWLRMGSIEGILEYLSIISVDEVKTFCRNIGQCNSGTIRLAERATVIEDLVEAMNPVLFPDAEYRTLDKRPLEKFAAFLLPSCSSEFFEKIMDEGFDDTLYGASSKSSLFKSHHCNILDLTLEVLLNNKSKSIPEDVHLYLTRFAYNSPSSPSGEKYFSSSMKFSEKILEKRLENPEMVWPNNPSEVDVYFKLLCRCRKRRLTKKRLHSIFHLGLKLLALNPKLKNDFVQREKQFWLPIKLFWGRWPEHWDDLVAKGLQLGLSGSSNRLSESFIKFVSDSIIKNDRTWALLRLFCMNLTKEKIDIDTVEDLKTIGKEKWSYKLFKKLPKEKAIHLLTLLVRGKPSNGFLTDVPRDSILTLTTVGDQHNFNALIYQTQLQIRCSNKEQRKEGYVRAVESCQELRRQSESSREQADRALYAEASGLWAIASGSLEIFNEHVLWLARFLRDPLTLKVVFGDAAIASKDASDLLSGAPDSISASTKLSEISDAVSIANTILLKFHEHQQVAKKEPSYQQYDWNGTRKLLGNAIQTRITRAKKIQDTLDIPERELYSNLWSQTLAIFSQIGPASMIPQVTKAISDLLANLQPQLLTSVTQSLLAMDDKYRAMKAAGEKVEDESNITERLAYRCLLALASSDNPTLADELVVRTVIGRPDAASWHRLLLGRGFFKRLPAKNAEQLLLDFSRAVGEKLEEQSYVRIGEAAGAPSIVKVTTVKYLAQILQNAQFISPEASIDVLLQLFKVATHPDVRIATLESILATLDTLAAADLHGPVYEASEVDNPLIRKILLALNAVVPVVGSINERHPAKEGDWVEAENESSKLPNPSLNQGERPLWTALVQAADASRFFRTYFFQKLLLPSIELSILEHRRWLTLFLKKHDADFSVQKLPSILPADKEMLSQLVSRFPQLVPEDILNGWHVYIKFLLRKPTFLSRFLATLEADEVKRNKLEVKHFLVIFGPAIDLVVRNGTFQLLKLIHHRWRPTMLPGQQGITLQQVQEAIIEQMHIVLLNYDKNVATWNALLEKFRHPTDNAAAFEKWEKDCRPVLKQASQMIDSIRTPQWLADSNRKPVILPSTNKPRLWALAFPSPGLKQDQSDSKCVQLGNEIVKFLKERLSHQRRMLNREKLILDIMTVSEKLDDRQNVQVGLSIGTFNKLDELEEDIRVRLSLNFLAKGKEAVRKDPQLKAMVAFMFEKRQTSLVEEVRELVLDLRMNGSHDRLWDAVYQKN